MPKEKVMSLKRNFSAPTFDFFKPKKGRSGNIFGIEKTKSDDRIYYSGTDHTTYLAKGSIVAASLNDLGGLTIEFSGKIEYTGNFGGGVNIEHSGENLNFDYEQVARVKNGVKVVWENYDVPKRKKLLA